MDEAKGTASLSIVRLEKLSCLRLPDSLREEMEGKTFALVSSWFAKIKELDTKEVQPLVNTREFHKDAKEVALREDIVADNAKHDALLANAPESEHGFFIVPKVVE